MYKKEIYCYYSMIVINSDNTSHSIYITPRYYNIDNSHTLSIKDDDTLISVTPSVTRTLEKGYIKYDFDLTTSEGKSYDFTITDATTTNVIHRGQLFATAQTSQNYKINE